MAQPAGSNPGKLYHDSLNGAGYGAHADFQRKEPGGGTPSATTVSRDTGRPALRASSTTSTTRDISNVTSTTVSASHADIGIGKPEPLITLVLHSQPAYVPSQELVHQDELELRASALEMRKAMESKEPLTQWQRICSKQRRVRLELPGEKSFVPHQSAYRTFAQAQSLALLKFGHLELRTDPEVRHAGQCFHEHLFFLRQVVENCNALKKAGYAVGRLGIELPLPRLRPDFIMHEYEASMVKIQLKVFLETIQTDKVIVSLGLSGIRSEWIGLDILANYFASLATNSQLEVLDLSNAELRDEDACALAAALEKNRSIRSIDLSGSTMPRIGMEALVRILKSRATLAEAL